MILNSNSFFEKFDFNAQILETRLNEFFFLPIQFCYLLKLSARQLFYQLFPANCFKESIT